MEHRILRFERPRLTTISEGDDVVYVLTWHSEPTL
jgi:hypothetical protein